MTKNRIVPIFIFVLTIATGIATVLFTNKINQTPVTIQKTQAVCESDPECAGLNKDIGYTDRCPDGTLRWCTNYKRFAADIANCGPEKCFQKCDDTVCDKQCSTPQPSSTPAPPTATPIPINTPTPTAAPVVQNTPTPIPCNGICDEGADYTCSTMYCEPNSSRCRNPYCPSQPSCQCSSTPSPTPTNTPPPGATSTPTPTLTLTPSPTGIPPTGIPPTGVNPSATPGPGSTNTPYVQPSLPSTGTPNYLSFIIPAIIILFSLIF